MFSAWAAWAQDPTAILVEKKTNNLHVVKYVDGIYQIVKTYHATLGQVTGDKQDEGDLKTPEGIYTFVSKTTPPTLPAKFGEMGFNVSFPNTFDQLAGHQGSNIMLHATNEPERLKKNYDSQGCIVVRNEEIREIAPYIRLGLTPVIIFPELADAYMKPGQDVALRIFFEGWLKAWEGKDLDHYIDAYHSDFSAQGKNKSTWREYKAQLNQMYASIKIKAEQVLYYRHPKYSMITFTQDYTSKAVGGGWGHRSRGTKILYVAEESGKPKIIAETYTALSW